MKRGSGRDSKKGFNKRAFVLTMIVITGIGLPVTGIANHIYQFSSMGVARHAWMSGHNILGLLFLAFSLWHVLLNRRPMLNYIRGLGSLVAGTGREALAAAAVVALALLLFVGHAFHVG